MGCIVGKSSAEEVLSKISGQKARIAELESKLLKSDIELPCLSSRDIIDIELRKSSQNLKVLSEFFPLNPNSSYQEKLKRISQEMNSSKAYIAIRLESSDHEYRISENLSDLMDHLKELDIKMCQKINSKSLSLSVILSQGQHAALLSDLQKVKDEQIILSSFRGGSFEEVVTRVSKRYDLDKELEIIQTKLENQQYFNSLNSEDSESKSLQLQMTELRNTRSDLERAWDMVRINTKSNDEEIKALQLEHDQVQTVVDDLEQKVAALEKTKEDLQTRSESILSLQTEIQEINEKIEKAQLEKNHQENLYKELQQALKISNSYKDQIESLTNTKKVLSLQAENFEVECKEGGKTAELEEKQKELDEIESELIRLENTSVELSEKIESKNTRFLNRGKKFVAMRLKFAFYEVLGKSFLTWKIFNSKEEVSMISSIGQVSLSGITDEDIDSIDSESHESSALFTRIRGIRENPMSVVGLFRYIEGIMDKKALTDKKDLQDKRKPRSIAEFLQESLSRDFGMETVNRYLAKMIPVLRDLYQQQDPYATIFCRLLGIFDPNPLPSHFAVFLTKARKKFITLNEKYENGPLSTQNHRLSRGQRDMNEEAKAGGLAQANDVIDLIVKIFENFKSLGTLALKLMRPVGISVEDYIIFQICQKIVRMGRSVEGVFNIIDKDASKSIDIKELSQFSRLNIDLWVDENDLELVFVKIATPGTEEIAKEVFLNRFSIKNYQELTKNRNYVITKAKFLSTLVEIFDIIQNKQRENIEKILTGFKDPVSKTEFQQILKIVDPEMESQAGVFFKEIKDSNELASHEYIQKLFLKHFLGEHRKGPFGTANSTEDTLNATRLRAKTTNK